MREPVVSEAASSPLGGELKKIVEKYRERRIYYEGADYAAGYAVAVEDMASEIERLLGIHAGGYLD